RINKINKIIAFYVKQNPVNSVNPVKILPKIDYFRQFLFLHDLVQCYPYWRADNIRVISAKDTSVDTVKAWEADAISQMERYDAPAKRLYNLRQLSRISIFAVRTAIKLKSHINTRFAYIAVITSSSATKFHLHLNHLNTETGHCASSLPVQTAYQPHSPSGDQADCAHIHFVFRQSYSDTSYSKYSWSAMLTAKHSKKS
ncbi:MAG: hypothetical protein GY943_38455, partial [Chloroflexi bacterium]|nr:hypothetical protein [Chloroflexota bacterium]